MDRVIFKIIGGGSYKDIGYKRSDSNKRKIITLINQLKLLGVRVDYTEFESITATKHISVEQSGIVLS